MRSVNLRIQWNESFRAVEVLSAYTPEGDPLGYLVAPAIPKSIWSLFDLSFSHDQCALLSGAGQFRDFNGWCEAAALIIEVSVSRHKDDTATVSIELEPEHPCIEQNGDMDSPFEVRLSGTTSISGFKTQAQAEAFAIRLDHGNAGFYFLDTPAEMSPTDILQLSEEDRREMRFSRGYGDMSYSVSAIPIDENGEEEGDSDSIYFDYDELPGFPGYYAVQLAVDSNSGSYCADLRADVVHEDDVFGIVMGWLSEDIPSFFYETDVEYDYTDVRLQLEELTAKMLSNFAYELVEVSRCKRDTQRGGKDWGRGSSIGVLHRNSFLNEKARLEGEDRLKMNCDLPFTDALSPGEEIWVVEDHLGEVKEAFTLKPYATQPQQANLATASPSEMAPVVQGLLKAFLVPETEFPFDDSMPNVPDRYGVTIAYGNVPKSLVDTWNGRQIKWRALYRHHGNRAMAIGVAPMEEIPNIDDRVFHVTECWADGAAPVTAHEEMKEHPEGSYPLLIESDIFFDSVVEWVPWLNR